MEIKKNKEGNVQIIELHGRLDSNSSKDLDAVFNELYERSEIEILCDMKGLDYISSAGLRVLLMAVKTINKKKGKLALCNMNEFVQEVFEIAGFTPLFFIFQDRQEALDKVFK